MNTSTRERRDWTLLIFLIPIGIIFMLIAGQFAVRLVPVWRVNAGMQSKLDPNNLSIQQNAPVQPISPAILTPLGWLDTFLTPGSGGSGNQNIVFPPFVVFEPTATPAVTASPTPTVATTQPSPTIPVTQTPTVVGTPSATRTPKPPVPTATTTVTATTTATTTATATATTTATTTATATATTTATATPIPTGYPSTPPVGSTTVTPPPDLGVDTPPDGTPASIGLGTYTVLNISGHPIIVSSTPDIYYDLVFYEALMPLGTGTSIRLDRISIGISTYADGSSYYEVFNWGDNDPVDTNTNTNVDTATLPPDPACTAPGAPECDNREIPINEPPPNPPTPILYSPDPLDPAIPQTGILIDVDNAPSEPPEGTYNYLVVVSPSTGVVDGDAQVDAIVVLDDEVPLP